MWISENIRQMHANRLVICQGIDYNLILSSGLPIGITIQLHVILRSPMSSDIRADI